jgi:WD40 repeat protein
MSIKLWDIANIKVWRTLYGHTSWVEALSLDVSGRLLASGSRDKTVRIWEIDQGRELKKFDGHSWSVSSVAFSPSGKTLASGSGDNTVRIWDVSTGKSIRTIGRNNPRPLAASKQN